MTITPEHRAAGVLACLYTRAVPCPINTGATIATVNLGCEELEVPIAAAIREAIEQERLAIATSVEEAGDNLPDTEASVAWRIAFDIRARSTSSPQSANRSESAS